MPKISNARIAGPKRPAMILKSRLTLPVAALLVMPPAFAESDSTSTPWEGEAELGMLITSGNTDETQINTALRGKYEVTEWRHKGEFRSSYSETEDTTTAEKYRAVLESDYKFADRQFWFVRAFYEDDRFSGYEFESSLTTGYGNRVWQGTDEKTFLDLTIGAGYRYNKLEVPDADGDKEEEEPVARFAGEYARSLSESALFRQELGVEYGFDDNATLTESLTSVQAAINSSLSMKVSYRVKHLSDPPEGAEETDTEFSVSLLYGF